MKTMNRKKACAFLLTALALFTASCASPQSGEESSSQNESSQEESGSRTPSRPGGSAPTSELTEQYDSFAQAHDAFTTTLAREDNDSYSIPEPPEGLFDLVSYPSKVGDLAAYVSSDPGDGQKHPMIIWVVGGWGNGIDDFPWCYPEWDNDQTGSAFWQAGLLTMYPSFRGGNGNPGYYEALFGEVDDIVSAYEYAASLPYVDPERIYLGGHSTGGTRALLASEYTDKFRAVFCFGAVDEIKYHNNTQFTFDTTIEDEYVMRSPIYWLDNVKSPTFLIEGSEGNAANLTRMLQASENDKISGYILEDADHFSVLAPITRVVAQKILADTGAEPNITITQEELDAAMAQEPSVPLPAMTTRTIEELGLSFSCPYLWEINTTDDASRLALYSRYEDDNAWDMSVLYLTAYMPEGDDDLQTFSDYLVQEGFEVREITLGGLPAIDGTATLQDDDGELFYQRYVSVQNESTGVDFTFIVHESYIAEAEPVFQAIIDSIVLDPAQ